MLVFLPVALQAQNQYYFGLDIGPKYDRYRLATGGTRPYAPSMQVRNDLGAFFGAVGGVILEEKFVMETGIYRSNFRAIFDLINEDGKRYFVNTPVNTFTAFMVPFIFSTRKAIGSSGTTFLHLGGGISTLIGSKMGITEVFYSHAEPIDPEDLSKGNIAYTILENTFNAKILTANLNASLFYPVNESVAAILTFSGRVGVAGNNYVDIEHFTPDHQNVKNTIYTTGTGFQIQFGFRYFLRSET